MAGVTLRWKTDSPAAIEKLRAKSPVAQARALNRSIVSANAALLSAVSGDMGLKLQVLRERIRVGRPATPEYLRAKVFASTKGIPLIQFRAKGTEPSRGKGRGVTAYIQGATVRYPHAFIATMPNGRRGVFERGSKADPAATRRGPAPNRSQLPIRELYGPSVWRVALYHRNVGLARGREQLLKNLQSEFRYVLAVNPAA